jgi:plasmid stabilization system protein ParE
MLAAFPEIGRAGQQPGTRELIVAGTSYVFIYEVQERRVYVLDIRDSRRGK